MKKTVIGLIVLLIAIVIPTNTIQGDQEEFYELLEYEELLETNEILIEELEVSE